MNVTIHERDYIFHAFSFQLIFNWRSDVYQSISYGINTVHSLGSFIINFIYRWILKLYLSRFKQACFSWDRVQCKSLTPLNAPLFVEWRVEKIYMFHDLNYLWRPTLLYAFMILWTYKDPSCGNLEVSSVCWFFALGHLIFIIYLLFSVE